MGFKCSFQDLSSVKPDFFVLSFYKLFGLPTGLGALLVRSDRAGGSSSPHPSLSRGNDQALLRWRNCGHAPGEGAQPCGEE